MTDHERHVLYSAAAMLRRVKFDTDTEYLTKRAQEVANELDEIIDAECKPKAEALGLPW